MYLGTLFLPLLLEAEPPFSVVIRATEGLAACSAKGVPSFLSYFKTLSMGPRIGNRTRDLLRD